MKYNFDRVINRKNNYSAKWSEMDINFGNNDLLPMWVADMDFMSPDFIMDTLKSRLDQGIFGYTTRPSSYIESISNWLDNRFNFKIKKDWLLYSPGVVTTISLAIQSFTNENDKIMIQQPVYSPFSSVVTNNNRELVVSPLKKLDDCSYVMDFDDIESKIKDVKIFILCNPHNPVGRVWSKEELKKLGDICLKYNVKVISDEIHSDIIYKNNKHTPFASICSDFAQNSITCMAPTKTFNLAGLQSSFAIIPNESDYKVLSDTFSKLDLKRNNAFSLVATEASYNYGEDWLGELLTYLEENIYYSIDFINRNIPSIKVKKPQGTYLLWLDFNELNIDDKLLSDTLINIGKVALNPGYSFGIGGKGFFRLNLACPRYMLEDALNRIKISVDSLI